MRKVIRIDEPKEESKKPIELTHFLDPQEGWKQGGKLTTVSESEVLFYLGHCVADGDIFVGKHNGYIRTYKGNLNDGVY